MTVYSETEERHGEIIIVKRIYTQRAELENRMACLLAAAEFLSPNHTRVRRIEVLLSHRDELTRDIQFDDALRQARRLLDEKVDEVKESIKGSRFGARTDRYTWEGKPVIP